MDAQQTVDKLENLQQTAEGLKDSAREWTNRARGSVRDAGAAADLYVHQYAWTSVALVAVAACLVGYWLGSSRE
jgi:ElaB/YqjD/DUF883 family membrane-anchored ribosome-binding protein